MSLAKLVDFGIPASLVNWEMSAGWCELQLKNRQDHHRQVLVNIDSFDSHSSKINFMFFI